MPFEYQTSKFVHSQEEVKTKSLPHENIKSLKTIRLSKELKQGFWNAQAM